MVIELSVFEPSRFDCICAWVVTTYGFALYNDKGLQIHFCVKRQAKNDSERCRKHNLVSGQAGIEANQAPYPKIRVYKDKHGKALRCSNIQDKYGSWTLLTLVLLNPDIPCLCKQCRSRSVGF